MGQYQKIKGTQDFYGVTANKLRTIEMVSSKVAKTYGFKEIITPIFENSNVFIKNVGEESDVVKKEMYTFKDKGGRSITLRPEGTAAVARSFIENKMYANPGMTKYYYYGPMFRYERPQTGRYREFNQFGVEAYGSDSPLLDSDIILSGYNIFKSLGIKNVVLHINSIGDAASRLNYSSFLQTYFKEYIDSMCIDCQRRLTTNPMRILDCKVDKENIAIKNAPNIT
ncbi:MAG: histidine--tRNA ligase, partial [Bacilli bacterium]